jgi:hypothetical protein
MVVNMVYAQMTKQLMQASIASYSECMLGMKNTSARHRQK